MNLDLDSMHALRNKPIIFYIFYARVFWKKDDFCTGIIFVDNGAGEIW